MNILVTGRGTSGSFQIRGVQLGHAIKATVQADCRNVGGYSVAILVKRAPADLLARLHREEVPIVWDVVDAWPQPYGNEWDRAACMAWLREQVRVIAPAAIVAATSAMARDCAEFKLPVLWLPHHARPNQQRNPIRATVKTVGYEGGAPYLGDWREALERQCLDRKWKFVVGPEQMSELDIVVALREAKGYAPRHWKSNVKLANAQGTATPFIGNPESGYVETASGAEFWIETKAELAEALETLQSYELRKAIADQLHSATPTLDHTAKIYAAWLRSNF